MTPDRPATSLVHAACTVLGTAAALDKAALAREAARLWHTGTLPLRPATGVLPVPLRRPARPDRPELLAPNRMPRRAAHGARGRFALLHAVAHIELNAIDLAFDMVARFAGEDVPWDLPRAFFDDWVRVGGEEARHFTLLEERLGALGGGYGDLPAHDGLWEAAADTAHDLLARLAVVPMVLEARGLDVTPGMIERLARAGDTDSAQVLRVIYEEEKDHVAVGARWFHALCAAGGIEPQARFQALVRRHFRGRLKPPFNEPARTAAGLPAAFYDPMSLS